MSADDGTDPVEQLRQQGVSDTHIQAALANVEEMVVRGGMSLREEIERRREVAPDDGGWRDPEDARAVIEGLNAERRREQFATVRQALNHDIAKVFAGWHIFGQTHETSALTAPLRSLVLSLHNPMVRESLLIAVADGYEDDAREFFAEVAAFAWGFIEALADLDGGDHLGWYFDAIEPALDAFRRGQVEGVGD